jgi:hypothetical protein
MKKLSNHHMLQITGGIDQCFWAGLASSTGIPGIIVGIGIAGGPSAYWNCVTASAPVDK